MKVFFRAMLLLFNSIACTTPPKVEVQMPLEVTKTSTFKLSGGNIGSGAAPLDISANLKLVFTEPIDPKSLRPNAIQVTCNNETKPVPGVERVNGSEITFEFERRFYFDDAKNTVWSGLKPDSRCVVRINPAMKSVSGTSISGNSVQVTFDTMANDMGMYWLAEDGSYEKSSPGISTRFYDPAKPVVLFVHGWENTTTGNGFFRENPFVTSHETYGAQNLLPLWKIKNYNIGLFYWPQIADESEVLDSEAKIWTGVNLQKNVKTDAVGPRFRKRNGEFSYLGREDNIAQILLKSYEVALQNYKGPGVRVIAHSLGTQLSTHFLKLLSDRVVAGSSPKNIFPSRLALLDPFWGNGKRSYLGNRWPGEVCREYLNSLTLRHNLAVEFIKSSWLGSLLVGDRNLDLRSKVTYLRLRPDFIPTLDQKTAHIYVYVWYLNSIAHPFSLLKSPFGAAATDSEIRKRMTFQSKVPSTLWQTGGLMTPGVDDDVFELRSGVDGG